MTRAKSTTEAIEAEPSEGTAEDTSAEPAPYEAPIITPVDEVEEAEAKQETPPKIPEGHVAIRYVGDADAFDHGAYQFRGGQPVIVPSEVAEELLTFPFEPFERA